MKADLQGRFLGTTSFHGLVYAKRFVTCGDVASDTKIIKTDFNKFNICVALSDLFLTVYRHTNVHTTQKAALP